MKILNRLIVTVPEWTKEKINSGKQGVIKVRYNAKHPGKFSKSILVLYNGEDSLKELTVKEQVIYLKGVKRVL